MTTYADLTAKAGGALTTAADHVTSSQDSKPSRRRARAARTGSYVVARHRAGRRHPRHRGSRPRAHRRDQTP